MTKEEVALNRNSLKRCPCCNGNIKDREVSLYKGLIDSLYKVYVWCGERKIHEFKMKDIRDILGKNDYARFGDLVRFGGIVYRPKVTVGTSKGHYGINMARAKEFYTGRRTMPVQIVLNQITNEIVSQIDCFYWEFPSLVEYLDKNGFYDHELRITTGIDPKSLPAASKKYRMRPIINRETNTVRFEREYL